MTTIDLNCDMGETPGKQPGSPDEALLNYVSSANIACGFHAGDPERMQLTIQAALKKGVAIGAHPGLPDLAGFGRQETAISPTEAYQLTIYQIGALHGFAKAAGGRLHHVKPHGALYNMAARDMAIAKALVAAISDFDPTLILYALAGSAMVEAARAKGIRVAAEGFIDRTYQDNGLLTPRKETNALITNIEESIRQSLNIILDQQVTTVTNQVIRLQADTLCIHGDSPQALEFAKAVHEAVTLAGITIQPPLTT